MAMTSKERALTAFAHQQPDRVPIDYLANPDIDRRLKQHFGLKPDDGEGLLQALGVDFRVAGLPYTGPRLHPEVPDRHVDAQWGIRTRWVEHESGGYWDYCDFPLKDADAQQVADWPMPSPDDFDYEAFARQCRKYSDYCVCMMCYLDIINGTGMIRTMEQTLVDLALDDEAGMLFVDRRKEIMLEVARRALEAADGAVDVIWLGEDLGTQQSPMISLDLFRRSVRPRHQPFVDLAKSFGIHSMMHCCGSSSWAFDDFAEMGITVIDTLQPEAKNMAPSYLKSTFGDRLAFHGCISTAGPLAKGTPEDVRRNVRQTLEIMKPSGGYALAPTHMIQDNTPTENAVAMFEEARLAGAY